MRIYQEKNKLIQKCKLKFNSFIYEKNLKNTLNNKDNHNDIGKQNKNKCLNNNKKSLTSNIINNKILKKNINQNNNFNKSNYKIKVKKKMNQNGKDLLVKKINNTKNLENINYNINENNLDNDRKIGNEFNSIYLNRFQHNINISRKHINNFNESLFEQNVLEKIKFIQLWWKTIFQIIKIQKYFRGFLYRQKLIEELDKEEIAVDNLLFLIKCYKKIVYNLFIFRLRKYKSGIKFYLFKWNEKVNKSNIVKKLIETYAVKKMDSHLLTNKTDEENSLSDIIKSKYDYDKNYYIKKNEKIGEEERKLSIEKYIINKKQNFLENDLIILTKNDRKSSHIRRITKSNNSNNINKINKDSVKNKFIQIPKKIKKNLNINNNINKIRENNKFINLKNISKKEDNYIKNKHISSSNQLILSCINKIQQKITKDNTKIINIEENKSEQKAKINADNKLKKNKIAYSLISKEIIPFSMNNNVKNTDLDENNSNTLNTLSNIFKSNNKKLKIYENHLHEYVKEKKIGYNNNNEKRQNKKMNKNDNNIKNQSTYLLKKNLISTSVEQIEQFSNNIGNKNNYYYPQNPEQLSNNNINTISSFNTSFLNSIKENNKINYNIIKYLKYWHNFIFRNIIKNRLRSLYLFSIYSKIYEKKMKINFYEKLKIVYNEIIISNIKNFFKGCINKIIKKLLIKCFMNRYFNKYKEIIFKKVVLENLIISQKRIYNEIEKDIKNFNKQNKIIFKYPSKNVIINNQNQLFVHINSPINTGNLITGNINRSMLNLIQPLESISLNPKSNIEYNYTEENQKFNVNKYNYKNKDIIAQMNQLIMAINLIEQIRIKKEKQNKEILIFNYFQKWKINSLNISKSKNHNKDNYLNEHTFATDIEELTQYTIGDNAQSESDLATKSDNLAFISSKAKNKYIPVRGVKYFQGKINQKINNKNDKKYKICSIIEKYKTNTILSINNKCNNSNTFNKNNKNEIDKNNLYSNHNYQTIKNNDLIKKTKMNEIPKHINSNNIYHRKALGATLKTNNSISKIEKMHNFQSANDSINISSDNNGGYFLGVLNNATFLGDCKIEPLIMFDNEENTPNIKENKTNESFDIHNLYGFKKLNKIEEKEIYFFPNNNDINNNFNLIKNRKNECENYDKNILNMIKKFYNEELYINKNEEPKKKYNSFLINIFNNNIIMTQKENSKRSKSK